jgi:hypothetical protein
VYHLQLVPKIKKVIWKYCVHDKWPHFKNNYKQLLPIIDTCVNINTKRTWRHGAVLSHTSVNCVSSVGSQCSLVSTDGHDSCDFIQAGVKLWNIGSPMVNSMNLHILKYFVVTNSLIIPAQRISSCNISASTDFSYIWQSSDIISKFRAVAILAVSNAHTFSSNWR